MVACASWTWEREGDMSSVWWPWHHWTTRSERCADDLQTNVPPVGPLRWVFLYRGASAMADHTEQARKQITYYTSPCGTLWGLLGGQNPCMHGGTSEAQHSIGTSRKTQWRGVFKIPLQSSWRVCTSECPGFSFSDDPRVKSETGFRGGFKSANFYFENSVTSFYPFIVFRLPLSHYGWHVQLLFCHSGSQRPPSARSSHSHLQWVKHGWEMMIGAQMSSQAILFHDFFHDSPFLMSCGRMPLTAVR